MPFYEYRCEECGSFPVYKAFDEEKPLHVPCPQCGEDSDRMFTSVVVHFHTEGFSKPRIDPFRTKTGQRPNYEIMEERAMETAEEDRRAGVRED
jgi:putative FmdB family regulatory protein